MSVSNHIIDAVLQTNFSASMIQSVFSCSITCRLDFGLRDEDCCCHETEQLNGSLRFAQLIKVFLNK